MTDEYEVLTCPRCSGNYVNQTACPRCEQATLPVVQKPTQSRKKAPKPKTSNPLAMSTPDKPKSLGSTGFKLTYPIIRYGVEINYVRWYKSAKSKGKDYNRFYYAGDWMSDFELWFYANWSFTGYPLPTPEHKFHDDRQWKFDYAWPQYRIAVELEGGAFSRGRHTRGKGYIEDCMKYNEATALGWRVYRFADKQDTHIDFIKAQLDAIIEMELAS